MAGVLKHTMVVRNPETMAATALLAGEELPDWAADLVHADNTQTKAQYEAAQKAGSTSDAGSGDGGGEDKGYAGLKVAELKDEIEKRNADREDDAKLSTDGNKGDLVAALEADDAAQAS